MACWVCASSPICLAPSALDGWCARNQTRSLYLPGNVLVLSKAESAWYPRSMETRISTSREFQQMAIVPTVRRATHCATSAPKYGRFTIRSPLWIQTVGRIKEWPVHPKWHTFKIAFFFKLCIYKLYIIIVWAVIYFGFFKSCTVLK